MIKITAVLAALAVLSMANAAKVQEATTTIATFDSKGVKIRYAVAGEGEAVVLIHGFMSDAAMWGADAQGNPKLRASKGFKVIALDCRGHGQSDKPHDPAKYGKEMAADVIRLLDHLKIKKAHLIGYSMGAYVAGKVAVMAPKRVQSVIYGGSAPVLTTRAVQGFGDIDALSKAVDAGRLGDYLLAVMPRGKTALTQAQADQLAVFTFRGKDPKALVAVGRGFPGLGVTPRDLAKCRVPTLFMYGENESKYVKDRIGEALAVMKTAETKVIPGRDHMTTLPDPQFGAGIMEFLGRNRMVSL